MGLAKLSYFCMVLLGSMIYNHKQSQIFCQRHKSTPTQRSLFNFRFTLAREAHIHRAQNIRNNIFVIIFNFYIKVINVTSWRRQSQTTFVTEPKRAYDHKKRILLRRATCRASPIQRSITCN